MYESYRLLYVNVLTSEVTSYLRGLCSNHYFIYISETSLDFSRSGTLNRDGDNSKFLFQDDMGAFQCFSCSAKFMEKFQLKNHISEYHGDAMPFHCELCGKGYLSRGGLHSHTRHFHHGYMFKCPLCDKQMSEKNKISRHMKLVHKSAQCTTCSRVFPLDGFDSHLCVI